MITHTELPIRNEDGTTTWSDHADDYRNDAQYATHWGKYDSAFHAYLVERCEADEYAGDTDYGGAVRYGKRVDYWTSTGFHSLVRFDNEEEAIAAYEEFEAEFYGEEEDEES